VLYEAVEEELEDGGLLGDSPNNPQGGAVPS